MKISKIFLYDEQSVPEIKTNKLADFIKKTFSIDTEIRKNIFNGRDQNIAKKLASSRIENTKKPFEIHTPNIEEVEFEKESFEKSIRDPEIIINTLRLNDKNGEIVGFVKGGALEKYKLREEIRDENYGLENTIFLEPLALKMGYWGQRWK